MATDVWVKAAGLMMMPAARSRAAMNPFDDLIFAIALMELDLEPELAADAAAIRLDLGERLTAINFRLALPEQVEIGTVQDSDDRVHAILTARDCHREGEATRRSTRS